MKRVCPLLERESRTRRLDIAPPPWVVQRCEETRFVYLENPPGYELLHQEHAWEVSWRREAKARREAEPLRYALSTMVKRFRRQVLTRKKIADLAAECVSEVENSSIRLLDLGCGTGELLGVVMSRLDQERKARCVPFGVEISVEQARVAHEVLSALGGECVQDNALNALGHFEPGSFDLIVMSSFLEHEIHPLPVMRRCASRLREGGGLLVKVPNYACWNRIVRGRRWCGYRWPDHVNYFTPRTLRAMGAVAGLEVKRMRWRDRSPLSDSLYAVFVKAAGRSDSASSKVPEGNSNFTAPS